MKYLQFGFIFLFLYSCESEIEIRYRYDELVPSIGLKEDFQLLKKSLQEVHPGLYNYHSKEELDLKFDDIYVQLNRELTPLSFYRKLLPLLPLIANNHTRIQCPITYEEAMSTQLPRFPLKLYCRQGKLFLEKDYSIEQVLPLGCEIESINGLSSKDILATMFSNISTDGYNQTLPASIISAIFSRCYAFYFGTPSSFKIGFLNKKKEIEFVNVKGLFATELNLKMRSSINYKPTSRSVVFNIENEVGYLKIPSFQPENARKYRSKLKNIFRSLNDHNISNLVIDVRDNGGGFGEAADEVFSYLIKESVNPYKDEYALVKKLPYSDYYIKDMFFKHFEDQPLIKRGEKYHIKDISKEVIKPNNPSYDGNLFILQNAKSASATGNFLGLLKSYTGAIFIGEEAGGNPGETSANDLLSLVLPNTGVRVTIPALRSIMNLNFEHGGHGVVPDVEVIPTIDDILKKKDVALDSTYKLIFSKNSVY